MSVIIDDLEETDPGLSNVTTTYDLSMIFKGHWSRSRKVTLKYLENGKRYDVV